MSLRAECQSDEKGDKEEGHRRLIQESEAGRDTEEEPKLLVSATLKENDGEKAGHPKEGFDRVHGEITVHPEILWGDKDANHCQGLGGAMSAERPG